MQINGVKESDLLDPLQEQEFHPEGNHLLSILVLNKENVTAGPNTLYRYKSGQHPMTEVTLSRSEILHIRDDEVFDNISQAKPFNNNIPFELFIINIIIAALMTHSKIKYYVSTSRRPSLITNKLIALIFSKHS